MTLVITIPHCCSPTSTRGRSRAVWLAAIVAMLICGAPDHAAGTADSLSLIREGAASDAPALAVSRTRTTPSVPVGAVRSYIDACRAGDL